jgi:esterase/lipase superfamily enzyme
MFDFRFVASLVILLVGGWLLLQAKPWTQREVQGIVVTAEKNEEAPVAAPAPPPPPSPGATGAGEEGAVREKSAEDQLARTQSARAGAEAPSPKSVDILFGTDRAPAPASKSGFDSKRGEKLTLGAAKVSIPPNHTAGVIERPLTIFNIQIQSEDAQKHFVLVDKPRIFASEAEFLKAIPPSKGRALLFVHGYNTSFEDGLYRAAQLAYDLNFDGPAFFYSWTSQGAFFDYQADNQSVANNLVQGYFKHFLQLIAEQGNVKNLTIIAHSKGNDLMLQALAALAQSEPTKLAGHISHLVLASPDVDRDEARSLIAQVAPVAKDVTLYANSKDIPLIISACLNSGLFKCDVPRAGALLADGAPLVVRPADSIDASAASFDLLGFNHNAYVYDDFLRSDLLKLVQGQRPPDTRSALLKRHFNKEQAAYWRYER